MLVTDKSLGKDKFVGATPAAEDICEVCGWNPDGLVVHWAGCPAQKVPPVERAPRPDESDPTTGRAMTTEDGEAGELVVKLRNMVGDLRNERRYMAGRLALDPDVPCTKCRDEDKSPGVDESARTTTSPTAQSCTLCGFMGAPSVFADHSCLGYRAILAEPNRFGPYEALDAIIGGIIDIADRYPDLDDKCEILSNDLHALRAYITGMEK